MYHFKVYSQKTRIESFIITIKDYYSFYIYYEFYIYYVARGVIMNSVHGRGRRKEKEFYGCMRSHKIHYGKIVNVHFWSQWKTITREVNL
jgi:hypothetical protein